MSSILLNPQLLFYSAALGVPALVVRFVCCFVCGIAAGICVRVFFKKKPFFKFTNFENMTNRDTDPNPFLRFLKNFGRNIKATGLYFLVGIILSSFFQRYVPQEAFAKLFGNNRGFGILMAAAIGEGTSKQRDYIFLWALFFQHFFSDMYRRKLLPNYSAATEVSAY